MTANGKIKKFFSDQKISKPVLISLVSLTLVSIGTFFALRDYKASVLTSPPKPIIISDLVKNKKSTKEEVSDNAIFNEEGEEHDDDHPIPTPLPSPTPLPTINPIPSGKIGFTVSQSNEDIPMMGRGSIDPYDPSIGGEQKILISVKDEQPITRVTGVLKTDNKVAGEVVFKLVEGSQADGTWEGSWKVNDSYETMYNLILKATSSRGTSSVEITLR